MDSPHVWEYEDSWENRGRQHCMYCNVRRTKKTEGTVCPARKQGLVPAKKEGEEN